VLALTGMSPPTPLLQRCQAITSAGHPEGHMRRLTLRLELFLRAEAFPETLKRLYGREEFVVGHKVIE
jgi:hypothetical protein